MNPGRSRREGSHISCIRLVGVLAGVIFWSASPMLAAITDVSSEPYVDVLPGQILIVAMSITRLDPTLTGDSFSFSLPAWNPNPFFPHQEYQCVFVTKTFKRRGIARLSVESSGSRVTHSTTPFFVSQPPP